MKLRPALIVTLLVSFLLSFMHCPLFEILYDDKEVFKYTGLLIAKGGVPYRDVFDHKPPIIFFINFLGFISGKWGLWIIDTCLVLFATLAFFNTCKKYKVPFPWILPSIFNLMLRNHQVSHGIGMTREYTTIFLLLFFCVMLGNTKYRFYILGLLASLVFFTQQDQILPLIPFLFYAFVSDNYINFRALAVRVLALVAGGLSVSIPLCLYFLLNSSLEYFWEDAFLFNFNWYMEKMPLIQHLKAIIKSLDNCNFDMIFYGSCILGIVSLVSGNRNHRLLITSLLAVALSFCSEILSSKLVLGLSVSYYFQPLATTIPILLFTVFAFSKRLIESESIHVFAYSAILVAGLFYNMCSYAGNLSNDRSRWILPLPEYGFLQSQKLTDYNLYIFYNSNYLYLYNDFKVLSPSKWIYHHFWRWFPEWDKDKSKIHSIMKDLSKHKTRFVLDFSDSYRFQNAEIYHLWKSFLRDNYRQWPAQSGTGNVLWELKP